MRNEKLGIRNKICVIAAGIALLCFAGCKTFNRLMAADSIAQETAAGGSTVLPSGEMEITSRVVIEFLLK